MGHYASVYKKPPSKATDCPGGRWCPHPGLGGDPQDIVRQLLGSMPRHCREYNVWTHYTLLIHIITQNVQCASVNNSSFNSLFIKIWCVMWSIVFIASCRGAKRTSCSLFKVRQSCNKGLDSCRALPPEVKLVWLHVLCRRLRIWIQSHALPERYLSKSRLNKTTTGHKCLNSFTNAELASWNPLTGFPTNAWNYFLCRMFSALDYGHVDC